MKKLKFNLNLEDFPKKYRGKYILRELSGAELLKCDEEAFERMGEEFQFNYRKWRLALLEQSLVQPKLSRKELEKLPAKLFSFLLDQATRLNTISVQERDFLLSQLQQEEEASTR